ncbi:roadblock/LC7 domain-containing protein [Streptomyces bobili]|uniref:roadblock/LC7 domain-containing protein n=1 Tax=Streptomyces bobili TaxID=67280 RepID=UPI000A3A93BB|nr:roadblock/LC7 domain-containing protein [Streptomyces bobili]
MAVEAEVLNELHRLRTRMPRLTGALAASVDGFVLAQDTPGVQPEGLAALTAAALGVGHRMVDLTASGEFCELLVRAAGGYVATYAAGPSAILTLLADDRANVGRLHLEGRRSGAHIAALIGARPAPGPASPVPAYPAVPPVPPVPGNRPLSALPLRIPQQYRPQRGSEYGG